MGEFSSRDGISALEVGIFVAAGLIFIIVLITCIIVCRRCKSHKTKTEDATRRQNQSKNPDAKASKKTPRYTADPTGRTLTVFEGEQYETIPADAMVRDGLYAKHIDDPGPCVNQPLNNPDHSIRPGLKSPHYVNYVNTGPLSSPAEPHVVLQQPPEPWQAPAPGGCHKPGSPSYINTHPIPLPNQPNTQVQLTDHASDQLAKCAQMIQMQQMGHPISDSHTGNDHDSSHNAQRSHGNPPPSVHNKRETHSYVNVSSHGQHRPTIEGERRNQTKHCPVNTPRNQPHVVPLSQLSLKHSPHEGNRPPEAHSQPTSPHHHSAQPTFHVSEMKQHLKPTKLKQVEQKPSETNEISLNPLFLKFKQVIEDGCKTIKLYKTCEGIAVQGFNEDENDVYMNPVSCRAYLPSDSEQIMDYDHTHTDNHNIADMIRSSIQHRIPGNGATEQKHFAYV